MENTSFKIITVVFWELYASEQMAFAVAALGPVGRTVSLNFVAWLMHAAKHSFLSLSSPLPHVMILPPCHAGCLWDTVHVFVVVILEGTTGGP